MNELCGNGPTIKTMPNSANSRIICGVYFAIVAESLTTGVLANFCVRLTLDFLKIKPEHRFEQFRQVSSFISNVKRV